MENDRCGNTGVALLIGVALGVGIALLYAPYSGRETRAKIRDKYDELTEKFEEMRCKGEETTEELAERMAERLS